MKFIDVCKLLPIKTTIELYEYTDDMETKKYVGMHTVKEIAFQGFWIKYKEHVVLSINPVGEHKVNMKIVKE